jgi:hypothetical protein
MPTSAPVASNFDYTALDLDTASFVRQQTGEIRALMRRATSEIFEIGQKLIEVKKRLGHGNYGSWLQAEFAWTERTALRFTSVVETFGHQSDMMSDLDFAPTALYTLAAPSISEEARFEAVERAKAGEFISAKKAEEIKQKYPSKNAKAKKISKVTEKSPRVNPSVEIIDAELESPPHKEEPSQSPSPTPAREAAWRQQVPELDEVKALPPSHSTQWWRLSGKEQKHLLFNGHPAQGEFLSQVPARVGIWLGFPPHPNQWLIPPGERVNTAFSYSTIYPNIDLKAVREVVERVLETSDEADLTAIVAYLPDPPLVVLLEDFNITCYIAEPSEAQCQKILSVWEQLGGIVEQLSVQDKT